MCACAPAGARAPVGGFRPGSEVQRSSVVVREVEGRLAGLHVEELEDVNFALDANLHNTRRRTTDDDRHGDDSDISNPSAEEWEAASVFPNNLMANDARSSVAVFFQPPDETIDAHASPSIEIHPYVRTLLFGRGGGGKAPLCSARPPTGTQANSCHAKVF